MALPHRRIVLFDSEGDLQMSMGVLLTVAEQVPVSPVFFDALSVDGQDLLDPGILRKKLELALALDNTGSMASNNNIQALKNATESFINILFDRTSRPELIRIGMVPYSLTRSPCKRFSNWKRSSSSARMAARHASSSGERDGHSRTSR